MSETTINASDKSDYSVWFEENPHKELQDFIEISEKNFEAFEDNNQQLSSLFRKGNYFFILFIALGLLLEIELTRVY